MITIRRFNSPDAKCVRSLITQIMNEEFRDETAAYPNDDLEDILRTYGAPGEAFFVASQGDKIVGTVAIKKEDDRLALMRRLFVAPSHRKQQLGLKLIDRALGFCQEMGYAEVIFRTTSRMEGANKICQKCGFVPRAKLNWATWSF